MAFVGYMNIKTKDGSKIIKRKIYRKASNGVHFYKIGATAFIVKRFKSVSPPAGGKSPRSPSKRPQKACRAYTSRVDGRCTRTDMDFRAMCTAKGKFMAQNGAKRSCRVKPTQAIKARAIKAIQMVLSDSPYF